MMNKTVIATDKSPAAIGPYSQAIEVNGMIYTSGVIGVDPKTGEAGATIEEQTKRVFENLKGLLEDAGSSLDQAVRLPFLSKIWMTSPRSMKSTRPISPGRFRHAPAWK